MSPRRKRDDPMRREREEAAQRLELERLHLSPRKQKAPVSPDPAHHGDDQREAERHVGEAG